MNHPNEMIGYLLQPFSQWDRVRNPLAGWTRVAMGMTAPFVIWSHEWLLIALLVVAVFSHPYWFPSYAVAGKDAPLMTRLVDAWQGWLGRSSPQEKMLLFYPGAILVLPLLVFLWKNSVWGIYFFLAAVGYKLLVARKILETDQGPVDADDED